MTNAKITYRKASNEQLVLAFQRLATIPMNLKLSYDFMKMADAVMNLKKKIAKEFEAELISKYAKKDEDGKLVVDEAQEGFVLEDKEGFSKAEKTFGDTEVSLDRLKISLKRIDEAGLKLMPAELKALESLLEHDLELPEVQELSPSA